MTETLHNFAAGLHQRLLDSQLDTEGRRWLEHHRAWCPECDRSFSRLERITAALESLPAFEPSRGFADRVLAEVRPAPLPAWARWRVTSVWQRAAATVAVGVLALVGFAVPLLGILLAGDASNATLLFSWPGLAADGLVAVTRIADPFRPLFYLVTVLADATRAVLLSPQGTTAVAVSALLAGVAFRQLTHVLVAPRAPRVRTSTMLFA